MARRFFRNPNPPYQIATTLNDAFVPPAGYVQCPEPDCAIPPPVQQYVSGYSGDRFGGGGNPADVIPHFKINSTFKFRLFRFNPFSNHAVNWSVTNLKIGDVVNGQVATSSRLDFFSPNPVVVNPLTVIRGGVEIANAGLYIPNPGDTWSFTSADGAIP